MSNIPPLIHNNVGIFVHKEKAEILAEHFHNIHNHTTQNTTEHDKIESEIDSLLTQPDNIDDNYITHMITSPKQISGIIHTMKNKKAAGEDRIDNKILKNLSRKAKVL